MSGPANAFVPSPPDRLAVAPLFVVLNSGSGSQDVREVRDTLRAVFDAAGRECELGLVRDPADLPHRVARAVQQARSRNGIVVAVGGDGTLNAVAQAVWPLELPMGVVPQGTFNYFSRELGIPSDAAGAAQALLDAALRPVQVGQVNGRLFLVNASLGLYPQLLADREAFARRHGRRSRWMALWVGLMTLLGRHRELVVELWRDGQPTLLRSSTLFVANNRLQLERIGISEAEHLARGELVGLSLQPVGPLAMAGLVLRGAVGQLGDAAPVDSFAFRELVLRLRVPAGHRRVRVALDGEVLRLETPLRFSVPPQPLWVMAPRRADETAP